MAMNDATPRKYTGSLLERFAELHPQKPPRVPPVEDAPAPANDPVAAPVGPRLRTGEELARIATPRTGAHRKGEVDRVALAEQGMLIPGAQVTALAEEFRLVKRQLLLTKKKVAARNEEQSRMILVCSAKPNDGKTFCAVNLAMSMAAEKDVEILLVDADFAKPGIVSTLGLEDGRGLLDALADPTLDVESCIIDTDVPQLSVLPAGTPGNDDTELLASDHPRRLLASLAAANPRRIVIFDSPPALVASPAAVLADLVGQVMLVVRADRTSEGELRETVQLLDACEEIQLVLNAVSFAPDGPRFGTYYGGESHA